MEMFYKSTRGDEKQVTASQAILKGLALDGGLFVPEKMPKLDISFNQLKELDYKETAYQVMKLFFTDYSEEELKTCINNAYDYKFDTKEIAPLVKKGEKYYLELFHGSTIAFKDMALSILPHLMVTAAKKNNLKNKIVILTATSGDTGKAALAGFANVPDTSIIVFYPKDGVSSIQEMQMVTQKGDNTNVVAIHGNFDDAQTNVKKLFEDSQLQEELSQVGLQFSSANSINIGRLVPQIVYYVYAYGQMLKQGEIIEGESINVVVPTGNFGNILAAYYAKHLGIPIKKLICASNENKVLYDFFQTGCYNKNRTFTVTNSPSMDILISSNLERLIYSLCEENETANKVLMNQLKEQGSYCITKEMQEKLQDFYGNFATQEETLHTIQSIFKDDNYVIDTHTAVATCVYDKYREETRDTTKTIIVATASPYKFASSVLEALEGKATLRTEFEQIEELEKISKVPVPKAVEELKDALVLHNRVCDKEDMKYIVKKILGL